MLTLKVHVCNSLNSLRRAGVDRRCWVSRIGGETNVLQKRSTSLSCWEWNLQIPIFMGEASFRFVDGIEPIENSIKLMFRQKWETSYGF